MDTLRFATFALALSLSAFPVAAPDVVVAAGGTEVGFSPSGSAHELVIRAIQNARHSIRVAAYSFTSKEVALALVDAHRGGVDVRVLLDDSQSPSCYTGATFLANSGIPTRINSRYAIMHNKFLVIDSEARADRELQLHDERSEPQCRERGCALESARDRSSL
jgi:phosphatidylserine/phosphatidylglycerophosphate/cardiolipin synthase-like enzyme